MQLSHWEWQTYFAGMQVVVIGGGIVGLATALAVRELPGRPRVVLLERGFLPSGASTKNAGFACFGSPSELLEDLRGRRADEVFGLVARRIRGLARLRERVGDAELGLEAHGGHEVFTEEGAWREVSAALAELNVRLRPLTGADATYTVADERIPTLGLGGVRHLVHIAGEAQIDTGRAVEALTRQARAAGVTVLTGIAVEALEPDGEQVRLRTSAGFELAPRAVVVCTNGFARQLLPELVVEPARAQVLVTEPVPALRLRGTFHYDRGYYYFRDVGGRVLLGGGRNLDFDGERTETMTTTSVIQERLDSLLRDMVLPGLPHRVERRWAGIMGVGPDKSTILREVAPGILCAVRLGGMGVALGSLVGEEAAALAARRL